MEYYNDTLHLGLWSMLVISLLIVCAIGTAYLLGFNKAWNEYINYIKESDFPEDNVDQYGGKVL